MPPGYAAGASFGLRLHATPAIFVRQHSAPAPTIYDFIPLAGAKMAR